MIKSEQYLLIVAFLTKFVLLNHKTMSTGQNIKKIREEKGMTQQQIAELINMHRSNYSKIESGQREISVDALNKIARHLGMTIDQIVNFDGAIPKEITIEDKTLLEQVRMIQDLEADEKNIVFKMVDTFLTKKKFKDFFQKNVAIL
jgi:transcriptional regulator with XRE-family HTH domain